VRHDRLTRADQQLVTAYRNQPSDPALVEAARRLASEVPVGLEHGLPERAVISCDTDILY
jgi:hypothetical protein